MEPERKTDRRGLVYYKLGAIDGFHENGSQYRKFSSYYPDMGMSHTEIRRELRIRQREWELKVRQMHDEERKKGAPRDIGNQLFSVYSTEYIKTRLLNKDIKVGTSENYSHYLDGRLNDTLGSKRMVDITTADIDHLLSSMRKEGIRKNGGHAVPVVNFVPLLENRHLSRAALAKKAMLSTDTVELVVKSSKDSQTETRFAISTASKIAEAIGMPLKNLFHVEYNLDPLSDKTILETYNVLRAIFGYAKRKGHISVNPMDAVDRPKHKRTRVSSLTKNELSDIHKAVMDLPESAFRWKMFVILLIVTASRRGEIAGLQWKHIDFSNGIVTIEQQLVDTRIVKATDTTKEDDYRPIKLAEDVLDMLRAYRAWYLEIRKSYILPDGTDLWRVGTTTRTQELQKIFPANPVRPDDLISDDDFLFIQKGGFPGHPDSVNSWMADFQKKNGLAPIYPHKIRHTVASELFAKGIRIEQIAELLGHANSSVTETVYVEVSKEAKILQSEALMNTFGLNFSKSDP